MNLDPKSSPAIASGRYLGLGFAQGHELAAVECFRWNLSKTRLFFL